MTIRARPGGGSLDEDPSSTALLSAALVWEVALRRSPGKLGAPADPVAVMLSACAQALPVTIEHAEAVGALPRHHRDPFDRILVAQAMAEGAALVTEDGALARYGVPVIW